jgi:DNA-binding Lrp family transcriptional regulator
MNENGEIDEIDAKILSKLIKNARTKLKDIGRDTGLSSVAIFKRIERLKTDGVIAETTILKELSLLGHPFLALLGVNLSVDTEEVLTELSQERKDFLALSPSIGKYDLCVFFAARDVAELDALKQRLRAIKGVIKVSINIWTESYFNFDNFELKKTVT